MNFAPKHQQDEGTMSLKKSGRNAIKMFGSQFVNSLGWRSTWAFIAKKRNKWLAEAHQKAASMDVWGAPVVVQASIKLLEKAKDCHWGDDEKITNRRKKFCAKYEGYGSVCSCKFSSFSSLKRILKIVTRLSVL